MTNMHEQLQKHRSRKLFQLEREWRMAVNSLRDAGDVNPIISQLMNDTINDKKRRFEVYKEYCMEGNNPRYPKTSDALTQIMCEKVVLSNKSQFQWPCVTGICQNCREFQIHEEVKSQNEEDEIYLVHYLYHTRCTVHGLLGCE